MTRAVLSLLLATCIGAMFLVGDVLAVTPSWMNTELYLVDQNVPAYQGRRCNDRSIAFHSVAYSVDRQLCVVSGNDWSVGSLYYIDRYDVVNTSVVSIGTNSNEMYPVTPNIFDPYANGRSWHSIDGSDRAIYLQADVESGDMYLYGYDDLESKFHQTNEGNLFPVYNFDQSNYDFQLTRPGGEVLAVRGFESSNDGRWAVMAARGVGIVVMNTQSGLTRKVQPLTDGDWQDFVAGTATLAITNDGDYVAWLSPYAQMVIATGDCGDAITDTMAGGQALFNDCDTRSVGDALGDYADSSQYADAEFANDGSWLDVSAGKPPVVALRTARSAVASVYGRVRLTTEKQIHIEYLALGDSYSSGEGDIGKRADGSSYYLPFMDNNSLSCHVSERSYPFLLRDKWSIDADNMKSVACSGARVVSDYVARDNYTGQHGELNGLGAATKDSERTAALSDFTPGVVSQIEFVKKYQPEIVTVDGGGNDVDFAGILGYCARPLYGVLQETCTYAFENSQMRRNMNKTIDDQYIYMSNFIQQIQEASPTTQIYLIGYPQFVAESGWSCIKTDSILLDGDERRMIISSIIRLNNVLARAARDTGVYYVDIADSLAGGRICEGSDYMTGPLRVIVDSGLSFRTDQNMFHPNAAGHAKMADAIARQIDTGDMHYDIIDIPPETGGWRTERRAVLPDYSGRGSTYSVRMDSGMFGPDGQVKIELFSQDISLGSFQTATDGSLDAQVTIPESIDLGSHLLTLSGPDPDGAMVQIQQFIYVMSDTPGDIDADGTPDDVDNCNFIPEWKVDGVDICNHLVTSDTTDTTTGTTIGTDNHTGGQVLDGLVPESQTILAGASSEQTIFHSGDNTAKSDDLTGRSSVLPEKGTISDIDRATNDYIVEILIMFIIIIGAVIYATKTHRRKQ